MVCAAQQIGVYSGRVIDPAGRPVAGASISLERTGSDLHAVTGVDGSFQLSAGEGGRATVTVRAAGFAPATESIAPLEPFTIQLTIAGAEQQVVVTADRAPLDLGQSANAVQVLSKKALSTTAALTLGDSLRQVAGFEPYRRTSALAANPTSQGVSLRGLGSTAASRTLVLANGTPISDPFGGWVYLDQIPSLAIQDVEVVTGGASSLYGSSAVGGVVNIIEREPSANAYAVDAGYGEENTQHLSTMGTAVAGRWSGLAASDWLRTDGYIEVAPEFRGPVDTPANVHYENGELYGRRTFGEHAIAFLRGNLLNEARGNGTPLQTNATRLWRYAGGVDWTPARAGIFALKLFGSQEHYRQSFSSVPADQSSETLTRLQRVGTGQMGAFGQWMKEIRTGVTLVAGADATDVRASDNETPISHGAPNGLADTSARQRDVGEYAEALLRLNRWMLTGSLRGDDFLNLDAVQLAQTGNGPVTTTKIPDRSETMFSPKLGVVRHMNRNIRLTASAYRAFRSPTLNELYRRFQVGQQITLANPELRSERATGWEAGGEWALPWRNSNIQASYFWTEVNRPVVSLTLSTTPSQIVQQRENLGQIRSRGVALNYRTRPLSWLAATGGYQYADATVTRYAQQPQLVGTWIPEVPHNTATLQVRAEKPKMGVAELLGIYNGRQYDSDGNTFLLHGYFQLDGYVSHSFGRRAEVYGAIDNVFNRSIEVGRTPILTLGTPRLASFGLRLHLAGSDAR